MIYRYEIYFDMHVLIFPVSTQLNLFCHKKKKKIYKFVISGRQGSPRETKRLLCFGLPYNSLIKPER